MSIDEFSLQAAREELEEMGLDEDSIDAALEAMVDALPDDEHR